MMDLAKLSLFKRKKPSALVGLALDGNQLDGVVLRRTNGSLQVQQTFFVKLSLDPLTNAPELVGREIRNHLDAAGVRVRHCVVAVPLKWAHVTHTKVPDLPEADLTSFLQIEAERGFPCDISTLMVATSRYRGAPGDQHATFIGVPCSHLDTLDQVLRGAQLKPAGFSLGINALQRAGLESSEGVLALAIGETTVSMQVTGGGGVAALRALEGAVETEAGQTQVLTDLVARETRITLAQLPAGVRDSLRRIRIFGPPDLARELAKEMEARFQPLGLKVEVVPGYAPGEFGVQLPPNSKVSAAFSLAAWHLAGRETPFEFMPPRVTLWQQLLARYSSGTLQRVAVTAGAAAALAGGLFLFQQIQLWRLRSQWNQIAGRVHDVNDMQQKIRQFRPWFDDSIRSLRILRQVTEAFPEDGVVSAKTVEINDQNGVTCSGVARDNQALLKTMERLGTSRSVSDLKLDQIRGRSPMQYTFEFRWSDQNKP